MTKSSEMFIALFPNRFRAQKTNVKTSGKSERQAMFAIMAFSVLIR